MRIFKLNQSVLKFSGDAEQFLNGLTSNTMDASKNAFLNIHGRIIATFDQRQVDNDVYAIVTTVFVDELLQHLDRYLKLSKAECEVLDSNVYFDCDGDAAMEEGDFVIDQNQGRIVITARTLENTISEEEFTLFRLQHNLPLHGVDYHDQMLLNVSHHDFASFEKGCFLGQEPLSKVHNRAQPTWKLAVVFEDECEEEARPKLTSKMQDPESNRVRGFGFIPYK